MKGRHYNPEPNKISSAGRLLVQEKQRELPWINKASQIEYRWQASIPEYWNKQQKGIQFKYVGEAKGTQSTIEFMRKTQKYIREITQPEYLQQNSDLKEKIIVPSPKIKVQQSKQEDHINDSDESIYPINYFPSRRVKILTNQEKYREKFNRSGYNFSSIFQQGNQTPVPVNVVNLSEKQIYSFQTSRLNSRSVSKGLKAIPKAETERDNNLPDWFYRFEQPRTPLAPPPQRGVSGWKLTHLKQKNKALPLKASNEGLRGLKLQQNFLLKWTDGIRLYPNPSVFKKVCWANVLIAIHEYKYSSTSCQPV